ITARNHQALSAFSIHSPRGHPSMLTSTPISFLSLSTNHDTAPLVDPLDAPLVIHQATFIEMKIPISITEDFLRYLIHLFSNNKLPPQDRSGLRSRSAFDLDNLLL
ncbi:hypothetical protein PIB30_094358, partial [Stylosanthes scabra]|nr:hypothetical protein [Stylosanthes scabra]